VKPRRRIAVLVNPASGKGRVSQHAARVIEGLSAPGDSVTTLLGDSAAHAEDLMGQAVEAGLDTIVAVGGDGTVHLALQAVVGTDTSLGIVPLGTGNDAAASLGIPTKDPHAAVRVVLDGHTRSFDVGHARTAEGIERYFLCVLSTGFDSLVTERANRMTRPSGDSRYVLAMLAELRAFTPVPYHVQVDDEVVDDDAMLVSLGNGPMFGGGMRVCPAADLHDGLLTMIWVHRISKVELLRVFPRIFRGTHVTHPAVTQRQVGTVRLSAPGQLAYADGERVGPLPVEVCTVRDGVRVLVPAEGRTAR